MKAIQPPHEVQSGRDCEAMRQGFRAYLEGTVTLNEARVLEGHLAACPHCTQALDEYKRMFSLMDRTIGAGTLDERFDRRAEQRLKRTPENVALPDRGARLPRPVPPAGPNEDTGDVSDVSAGAYEEALGVEEAPRGFWNSLSERFGAAPWWMISGAFHGLLLLLLTLIGMAIYRAQKEDVVIMTNLEQQKEPEKIKEPLKRDIFKKPVPIETTEPVVTETQIVTHEEVEVAEEVETDNDSDAHEAVGDEGISDVPLGGSGTVAALGLGGGGGGAFGRPTGAGGRLRRAIRNGGGRATESAVDKALQWLARHQEADGHWEFQKYEPRPGFVVETYEVGSTAFGLLAFLGAGHSEKIGKYKDNVRRATHWLLQRLGAGKTRFSNIHGSNYAQGVAAMALSEAAAMGRNPKVKDAAQRAVDGVVEGQIKLGQSEYFGWDYAPGGHTCDTSVTGWNVMALKSAKAAGLHVDPASFDGAMRWINAGQDLRQAPKGGGGDAAYWEGGMMTYRGTSFSGSGGMGVTAIAALTRLFVGSEKPDNPGVAGPCNLMKQQRYLPLKYNDGYKSDRNANLYYWYYGTLAMFQTGGEHWKLWNEAMKKTLLQAQRKDGDFDGSWNPHWPCFAGRVMTTALGAMCLEVYYRYLPLFHE